MDKEQHKEKSKAIIATLHNIIASGTLMPDQMEAALRAIRILQKLQNAHSEKRIKHLTIALAEALAQVCLKVSSSKSGLRPQV